MKFNTHQQRNGGDLWRYVNGRGYLEYALSRGYCEYTGAEQIEALVVTEGPVYVVRDNIKKPYGKELFDGPHPQGEAYYTCKHSRFDSLSEAIAWIESKVCK